MKLHPFHIIAMLAAAIFAMFSIDTAGVHTSSRSYRTYGYGREYGTRTDTGDGPLTVMQDVGMESVRVSPQDVETVTENHCPFQIPNSELSTPPVALSSSAMTELSPAQLPPLDAGMVNVTGGFDENMQTAGYRVKPMPGEFAIAVPYDPSLLPQGFTEDDIQTFVYDRQYQHWVAIQRDSVNEAELLVCSRFRPWERGLPHTQNDMSNPQDVLAQAQDMMSMASQGEGGGESPLDFINAVLKTPEMPETSAYTPTSIKELKAADPLEGLTLMQPPTANNSGTANLSYPIEIPAGRQGMQPNLALTYSSGSGNGWLGVGWDISIPSITVETRWGVPRYDPDKESEVYVYEGEQLVTIDGSGHFREMPHRTNQWTDRNVLDQDGLEQFYPRKNEAFDSIVRHGSGPDSYWWTVTHKNGVTDYYGKYASDNSVNNSCVLRAGASNLTGPIAHWALAESVDPFGNSVRYYYSIEYDRGFQNSSTPGRQIYIDSIRYTGLGDDPGKYKIVFTRGNGREDVIVSANRGFKEVTASTLCNIAVCYNGRAIRYYLFLTENTRSGNYKTRLTDVVQLFKTTDSILPCSYLKSLGSTDTLFTTHFDYFDFPASDQMFGDTVSLSLTDDTVKSTFITAGGISAKATALGGTRGKSWNVGGTATIGAGPVVPITSLSVGGNFNYSRSKSEGALTLIDLDGDGLADKVYKKGKKLYYRKHIADSDYRFHYDTAEHELKDYSDSATPQNIKDFLSEVSSTTSWGLQLSIGLAYSGSWPTTKSTTSVYFADVNADGLPDLVTDGGVLFNVTERDGVVKFRNFYTIAAENIATGSDSTFVHTSTDTCGGIIFDGAVSDSVVCQTEWVLDSVIGLKPMDHPDDTIYVYPTLRFADSLERTGNYWCRYTYYEEYPEQVEWIHIYRKEIVSCTPFPVSASASELLERDPDLETVRVWVAPKDGTVVVSSNIRLIQDTSISRQQSRTCDGVSYAIQHSSGVSATPNHTLSASTPSNTSILDTGSIGASDYSQHSSIKRARVHKNDILLFRLISGDNHDFDNVDWQQTIHYMGESDLYDSQADFVVSGNKCFGAGKPDSVGNNRMDVTFVINTGTLYPSLISKKGVLHVEIVDDSGSVTFNDHLDITSNSVNVSWNPILNRYVPERHHIRIYVTNNNPNFPWNLVHITPHINYYVDSGDRRDTIGCYPQVDMRINNYDNTVIDSVYHRLFGPLFRGWGQFAYHNNDTLQDGTFIHDDTIHLEKLIASWDNFPDKKNKANQRRERLEGFDMTNKDSTQVRESSEMLEVLSADTLFSPLSLKTSWVEMEPDFQHQAWVGYGNINFVTSETMCNTRMPGYHTDTNTVDIEDYDHPVPVVADHDVKTVRKQNYSKMKNHSLSLSVPTVPFSVGTSVSQGYNMIISDYMDMNGDRYPDIVGQSQVQYSMPWGGIGDVRSVGFIDDGVTRSETVSGGTNFGGSYEIPSRGTSNNPKNSKISFNGAGNAGANLGGGKDSTSITWMDMNADGLPDKVIAKNNALEVSMNTGYGILPADVLNAEDIRKGSSANFGINIGGSFNIGQASIGGGMGVNFSRNETGRMLLDFNGDGLPDMVENSNGNIFVSYNQGNGNWFSPEYIDELSDISLGRSFSESADVSITVGFTFFSVLKVCLGISGSPYSRTFSKDSIQITDINGDGYADYVTSRNEGSMTVRYNRSGKTNLLRKVTNFTGSTVVMDYDMPLACHDKPQRNWNLASVETGNNVPDCPVGGNSTYTTFEYEAPHYSRHERMDYGYGTVITRQYDTEEGNTLYRYTVEEFNNHDFAKRGRKTRDCVYDASGKPYVEHIYGDTLYDFAGSVVEDGGCARADIYVRKEVDITNWYEGEATPHITSMVEKEYDRHRNVIRYTHYGDTSSTDEWFKAEIMYATNMPHNMVALPVGIEVRDRSDSLLQKRTAVYNQYNGRMEALRLHGNTDTALYSFAFDTYGNMTNVKLPANAAGQQLEMMYNYDDTVHTYPVRVDNVSMGWFSTSEYDCRFGKPTRTVDINGNAMCYAYDSLGRTVAVTAPYEIDSGRPYSIRMEYHPHNFKKLDVWTNSPNPYSYACTFHYDRQHPDNPIRTTLISDGFGRLLQTKKDAEIGGQEVSLVTGKVEYDCFGRTVAQYHPFTEDTALYVLYNNSITVGTATLTEYDIMDRQTQVTQPYGYVTITEYGFDTCGMRTLLWTNVKDALGNNFGVLKGTIGQQIKQTAPYNTATRFEYDCLGRLIRSRDPDGFFTEYEYDMLGRMIRRAHPDAGVDSCKYDPAGNLIRRVNAAGERLDYTYNYNQLTDIHCSNYPENNVHYEYGTSANSNVNAVGKVILQEDGSGWQMFKYGKMGEVTDVFRTFVLPYDPDSYTFGMTFEYDSWNRIQEMSYPDGEVVSYSYDKGGMLNSITSSKNGVTHSYMDSIRYNRYGLRDTVFYGNGSWAEYSYDDLLRLCKLKSHTSAFPGESELMQDIVYEYDPVDNITRIYNYADRLLNGMGGQYDNHYVYDNLYRLSGSVGDWYGRYSMSYTVNMAYHPNGRVSSKSVSAQAYEETPSSQNQTSVVFNNSYYYNTNQPNTLAHIGADAQIGFWWDSKGNMTRHYVSGENFDRRMCWDERNRLMGVVDNSFISCYQYDADGERVCKLVGGLVQQNRNGERSDFYYVDSPTLYASPYLVATPQGYTKHYYADNERIASRIGGGGLRDLDVNNSGTLFQAHVNRAKGLFDGLVTCLDASAFPLEYSLLSLYDWRDSVQPENDCYWYHPDHLGSSSWITYSDGKAVQHLHYLPWGEDFINQRTTDYAARFTFSAKEKDQETGFSYFGSRYYSSDLSIWLSVDPMSDYYPEHSPYVFCGNNPILYVDEVGTEFVDFNYYFYQDPPQKKDPEKPNTDDNPYVIEEVVITTQKEHRTRRAQWVNIISAPVSFVLPFYVEKVATAIVTATVIPAIFVGLSTLMQGDTRPNQYSKSNGKNESHGDNGRALEKADKQLKDLEKQYENSKNRVERQRIRKKIDRIRKDAQRKRKGENHSNGNKR